MENQNNLKNEERSLIFLFFIFSFFFLLRYGKNRLTI